MKAKTADKHEHGYIVKRGSTMSRGKSLCCVLLALLAAAVTIPAKKKRYRFRFRENDLDSAKAEVLVDSDFKALHTIS